MSRQRSANAIGGRKTGQDEATFPAALGLVAAPPRCDAPAEMIPRHSTLMLFGIAAPVMQGGIQRAGQVGHTRPAVSAIITRAALVATAMRPK